MKLYLSPGACSLADHIALHEADMTFEKVKVDLKTKRTEDGRDFNQINPKSYVPALELENGEVLTENVAIMTFISDRARLADPDGDLGRYRLIEMLTFISTEIHKQFKPFFDPNGDQVAKAKAAEKIGTRFKYLAGRMTDDYLFGDEFSVADGYLFTMLTWAKNNNLDIPERLETFFRTMLARPAVTLALQHEGLGDKYSSSASSRDADQFEARTAGP
ncbi:MAG TPA: glutathione binding-like protein [Caulobacteraceae bacterium]|nr:glutathione binding-like protein [Caulobacteraceae bacterium]